MMAPRMRTHGRVSDVTTRGSAGRRLGAGLLTVAALGVQPMLDSPVEAAPNPDTSCVDWLAYTEGSQPVGSDHLGPQVVGGGANPQTQSTDAGEQRTLLDALPGIDLRLTWSTPARGSLLDITDTDDFTDVNTYAGLIGAPGVSSVLRYWPNEAGGGSVTFEFFHAGTTDRVQLSVDEVLNGGFRNPTVGGELQFGVNEVSIHAGGPTAPALGNNYADPDATVIDTDPADGLTGHGTSPIIQLDTADYGTGNSTIWNEARNSFVSTGPTPPEGRDWSIFSWGGARADTIVWQVYGGTSTDPEAQDPAAAVDVPFVSQYLSGLCVDPTVYDLAVIKSIATPPANTPVQVGDTVVFDVTVSNQGTETGGEYTVTDSLSAGLAYVSDTSGVAADVSGSDVSWTFADVGVNEQNTFQVTAEITDASLTNYRNDVEITADSGDDADSTPDSGDNGMAAWDDHDDPLLDVDGPNGEFDDHDAAEFPNVPEVVVPVVPETTLPATTVPETTVPEVTVPETTVPATTVPEVVLPVVPETTVPETTVPATTVPATTVPDTPSPATTVEPDPAVPTTTIYVELPATGSSTGTPFAIAWALLIAGLAAMFAARRKLTS